MKRTPIIIVALVILAVLLYSSIFVVNEREQALVLRFGEIRRVIQEPGINFKIPTNFVETVQIIDDRILRFDIDNIRVQVRDGRRYLVDAFVAFRITDPRKFREAVSGNLTIAQDNLRTRLDAALRRVYGQRSFEDALSAERAKMMEEVRDQLRPLAADLGINIVDVRIRRTDLLQEVSQQTFERMKAERLAEAAELRATGTQESLRIRAEADREAVVTVAEAQREGEIIRGEGDAERNRIYAEAFQRDPEFFEFYRSMLAYVKAIEGTGTTMVLSPDSEFFRYFGDAGRRVPSVPEQTSQAGGEADADSGEETGSMSAESSPPPDDATAEAADTTDKDAGQ